MSEVRLMCRVFINLIKIVLHSEENVCSINQEYSTEKGSC